MIEDFARRYIKQIAAYTVRTWKHLLLAIALVIFFAIQMYLVVGPITVRSLPVELDDSMVYIIKAVQLKDCFDQKCQGLADIWSQVTSKEAGEGDDGFRRFKTARNFFHVYHPVHSAFMIFIHSMGVDWEEAFDVTRVVGSFIILSGIALWVYTFLGTGPTAIALLLLAFTIFPAQGIHYVVPSNISIGITFLLWALIMRRVAYLEYIMLFGSLVMLGLHQLGVMLTLMLWGYYYVERGELLSRRALVFTLIGVLLSLAVFYAQHTIREPMFVIPYEYKPAGGDGVAGYYKNIIKAKYTILEWLNQFGAQEWLFQLGKKQWLYEYGGTLLAMPLLVVGWVTIRPEFKCRKWIILLMLGGMIVLSIFFVFPPHPALLFRRLWLFASLLWICLIAQALWFGLQFLVKNTYAPHCSEDSRPFYIREITKRLYMYLIGLITLAGIMQGAVYVYRGAGLINKEVEAHIARHDYDFDSNQVALLLKRISSNERVLYTTHPSDGALVPVPALFYFIHGAMDKGAVFQPLLKGPAPIALWTSKHAKLRYLAGWTPLMTLPNARRSGILLKQDGAIVIDRDDPFRGSEIAIRLAHESAGYLTIVGKDMREKEHMVTIKGASDWQYPWAKGSILFRQIEIRASDPVDIVGLRIERQDTLRWPWGKSVKLTYLVDSGKKTGVTVSMNPDSLYFLGDRNVRVLDDHGATFFAEFRDEPLL